MNGNAIRIPNELHERCLEGVRRAAREKRARRRKWTATACALAACMLVVAGPTIADALRGEFRDIYGRFGAITGTEYVNATDEVRMSLQRDGGGLYIEAELLYPDDAPYAYIQTLRVGESSPALASEAGEVMDGRAHIKLVPDSLVSDMDEIRIYSLIGEAKAEQPLEIKGEWTVEIPFE